MKLQNRLWTFENFCNYAVPLFSNLITVIGCEAINDVNIIPEGLLVLGGDKRWLDHGSLQTNLVCVIFG